MKTFKVHFNLMKAILLSLIFTGSIFLVSCNDIVGSDSNLTLNLIQPIYNPPADSIYAFPVKPGMEIWSDFESHAEKVDACQIPDQKLQNLTTAGLIKACLDYPLLLDFSAYDNLQDGFNAVVSNFNGFQELLNRKDAPREILEFYKNLNPTVDNPCKDVGAVSFELIALEMLLSEDRIIKQYTESDKNELLSLCVDKHYLMAQNANNFGLYSCVSQSLVIYRVLETVSAKLLKTADVDLNFFVHNGNMPSNQGILIESYDLAVSYLNSVGISNILDASKLKGATVVCTPFAGTVKTPKGSNVSAYVYGCEPLSNSQIVSMNNQFKRSYPKAVLISSASGKYNCHSFAWYSQSSSNYRWINDPSMYWNDRSYIPVNYCAPNNVCTYNGTSHSAIAISYYGLPLLSKWGMAPLMAHNYYDCPYPGTIRSYKRN